MYQQEFQNQDSNGALMELEKGNFDYAAVSLLFIGHLENEL